MQTKSLRPVFLAVVLLGIGAFGGMAIERAIHRSDEQYFDLIRVAWAVDLNNRLEMLRLLRQHKVHKATIESVEIDAVVLLDTMDTGRVSPLDQSYPVIERVVKNLRQYRKDFPDSEFDPKRRAFIAKVLEKFPESQSSR